MAINSDLYRALLKKTGWSPATLSRKAEALRRDYGPMTPDEARYIIAHEHGIDLRKYPIAPEELDRVQTLRASGATVTPAFHGGATTRTAKEAGVAESRAEPEEPRPPTPSALFDSRGFHPAVVRSSKKRFVSGHRSDAIRAAFQAVNNRVRKMGGISGDVDDGQALMGEAFKDKTAILQMTDRTTGPEKDEHAGLRFLAMGGMRGLRNPRSHADEEWWTDGDVDFVLECLALASLLHRCLDHCQERSKRAGTT